MKLDSLLLQKCKNNKQRKLANIRVRNAINKSFLAQKVAGEIKDFKLIGVKIANRVQSVGVQVVSYSVPEYITVGFKTRQEINE